ncbi:AcrR family transcriptional regulator [Microbacterium terrae]|uniref:HTH-type transcriptional regulator RutR n=1 Tax=Microbacterium terrae TaxID=69369 RepID=A0A0M2HD91_9MICO|nr:TetR/AcrR family transcriptional regulator [Microbacterium terrae]KJL44522.1 HTH-type transcriptional regulator RutR [Microbacterium terrae]MBP1079475.1 AcrR family transcriptional regulator [Microbacterium terrae]GLJ96816.1 putative transcriptional regulator, TetR family protein [Microbacterium terrae]
MPARGPYRKTAAKREEILRAALDVVDKNGFSGATVKELAEAVDMSQNGMLYYFGSKDALFLEILRWHDADTAAMIDPEHTDFSIGFANRILDALSYSVAVNGISQLLLSLLIAAGDPEHPAHTYFRERYESFVLYAHQGLSGAQARGEFPADGDPEAAAVILASSFDGLQLMWMYDPSIDVRARMAQLLSSLGVSDAASTETSSAPTGPEAAPIR